MTTPSTDRPVFNDRYEIQQRIGRGGMADVFLARDLLLDRPVAIKVLFPEYATDPNFVERFRREAQSAANLNHPNIVGVYDWGKQSNTYFMAMEYVHGRTLADILRSNGKLRPDQATDIAMEVAGALGFAHRGGVVHRDIKPANILIANDGRVKVADFGIARALNSANEQDLTQAGAVMGTATYFSPEQAQGAQPDPRSDLYSLGIVLYEMVGGRPPFVGDNPVGIAYKQVHETPQPLNQLTPNVPRPFEAIVAKLLAKNPAVRYPTAEALRDDLRRFRDGQPVQALTALLGAAAAAAANGNGTPAGGVAAPTSTTPTVPVTSSVPRTTVIGATGGAAATTAVPRTGGVTAPIGAGGGYQERRSKPLFTLLVALLALAALAAGGIILFNVFTNDNKSAETVGVPALINLPFDQAVKVLNDAGLDPDPNPVPKAGVGDNIVYDQSPLPDEVVPKNSKVTVTYNPGKQPVQIPTDLVGKKYEEAEAELAKLGLAPVRVDQESPDVPVGVVISSDPSGGQQVVPGATVKLNTSLGKGTAKVPNVQGLNEAQARDALTSAGLVVREPVKSQYNATVPAGQAITTDPPVNTQVDKGTPVTLFMSLGAEPVAVPDVSALTEAQARDILQQNGLVPRTVYRTVANGSASDGHVLDQDPSPNTQVAANTTVTITVGRAAPAPATTTTTKPPPTTAAPATSAASATTAP
jgi:serine/threonine-protein kinase